MGLQSAVLTGSSQSDRDTEVYFPQQFALPHGHDNSGIVYDSKPADGDSATLPHLAVPTYITGCHIFQASRHSVSFPCQNEPAKTFHDWCKQLPEAKKRFLLTVSCAFATLKRCSSNICRQPALCVLEAIIARPNNIEEQSRGSLALQGRNSLFSTPDLLTDCTTTSVKAPFVAPSLAQHR